LTSKTILEGKIGVVLSAPVGRGSLNIVVSDIEMRAASVLSRVELRVECSVRDTGRTRNLNPNGRRKASHAAPLDIKIIGERDKRYGY